MGPEPSPLSTRSPRRLLLPAGLCLALLAAATVALPLLVLRQWPASPAPRARPADVKAPRRPGRAGRPGAAGQAQRAGPRRGGRSARQTPPTPAHTPAAAPGQGEPIVELRRVQTGERLAGAARPRPAQTAPASAAELDRSPALRRRRVERFGGTARTESAVEAGLAWLAAHQSADGSWDRFGFQQRCPPDDVCPGPALRRASDSLRAGLTGLALLAFLGAGYTDRAGPFPQAVRGAVEALLRAQQADGGFSVSASTAGYNDTLATFALAEYYAMTADQRVADRLRRAVARLALSQQELGGWDYYPAETGRNDTSITAWAVQALQTCAVAGIKVPRPILVKAALHFARAAQPDGRLWYADAGTGFRLEPRSLQAVYRYGPAMTAAGLTCEQFLGWRIDSPLSRRQQALLLGWLPSAELARGRDPTQLHNEYYWYYGTAAMFQVGGQRWHRWNARLRDTLLPLQDRRRKPAGRKRHSYGSWPPYGPHWGKWGRTGSRVYTTAICTLTLEIYYRHTPAYLQDRVLLSADDWRSYLRHAPARVRKLCVKALREMRLEMGEPVLIELLRDRDPGVALAAAEALAAIDSPLGRPLLEELAPRLPVAERLRAEQALRRAARIATLPPAAGRVRDYDRTRGLATLELDRAYVGMAVDVRRNAERVARLRIVRRFSGAEVVLAKLVEQPGGGVPRAGDSVVAR